MTHEITDPTKSEVFTCNVPGCDFPVVYDANNVVISMTIASADEFPQSGDVLHIDCNNPAGPHENICIVK